MIPRTIDAIEFISTLKKWFAWLLQSANVMKDRKLYNYHLHVTT